MTAAIKTAALLCISACVVCGVWAADAGRVVRSATSNDIWALAGSGDTVWMVTAGGVNFAIDKGGDSLSWWGYTTHNRPNAINFNSGRAIVSLGDQNSAVQNKLWWYDHNLSSTTYTGSFDSISFNRTVLDKAISDRNSDSLKIIFNCYDIAYDSSFYWLAFQDGGLVRWNHAAKSARVFSVGSSKSVSSDSFPIVADTTLADTNRRVLSVDVTNPGTDTELIYVATPHAIWTFSPADSTWDTLSTRLADPAKSVKWFVDVTVNNRIKPAGIFAFLYADSIIKPTIVDSIMLYKYERSGTPRWVRVVPELSQPTEVTSLTFGLNGRMYTSDGHGEVFRFADQAGTAHFPQAPLDGGSGTILAKRLFEATDVNRNTRKIRDVLSTVKDTVQRLWISSSNGLYYSSNEVDGKPFRFYRTAPRVPEGLKGVYVFPGLLTNRFDPYSENGRIPTRAEFAYNLTANAKVTIRIFDFNMDLVKTVIENQPRIVGANRESGRSTVWAEDFWDGTDRFGRIVSPGVYYYRISTDKGDRAMGRIVVALQRK